MPTQSSVLDAVLSPGRKRTYWQMMLEWLENPISPPSKAMPAPGAVWPRIVRFELQETAVVRLMTPPTSKTMMRLEPLTAERKEPAPESLRFVTCTTVPVRPPVAIAPKPSAAPNDRNWARTEFGPPRTAALPATAAAS